jgi:YgiT-type zinc finger domain-containing protein
MKCIFCKGKITDGIATDVTDLTSCVIIVRNVPCHKCEQCGEVSFTLDVSERLEQIVDKLRNSDSVTEVAIVRYTDIAA